MDMTGKTSSESAYHALLMEYASGCMDEAHALVIATHMALSPSARRIVAGYEDVGGAMLHAQCAPVAMKADARQCVMDRLEKIIEPCAAKSPCSKKKNAPRDFLATPACLESYIETTTWRMSADGRHTIHVKTSCSGSKAHLMKIEQGRSIKPDTQKTGEIALILQGAIKDESRAYTRGDLLILEKGAPYLLLNEGGEGCVVIAVRPSTSRLRGMLKALCGSFKPKSV